MSINVCCFPRTDKARMTCGWGKCCSTGVIAATTGNFWYCVLLRRSVQSCSKYCVVRNKRNVNITDFCVIVMDRQEEETSEAAPLPCSTSKQTVLTINEILEMAESLSLEDYRSFVRSLWLTDDQRDIVRDQMWNMSTHRITTTFINGDRLDIEYNYDPARKRKDRYLINMDSLSPIFGGVSVPWKEKFVSISTCTDFVEMHVHLNMCSGGRYSSCSCPGETLAGERVPTFAKHSQVTCKYEHVHHYCAQHVRQWLLLIVDSSIVHSESITQRFLDLLRNTIYLRAKSRRHFQHPQWTLQQELM